MKKRGVMLLDSGRQGEAAGKLSCDKGTLVQCTVYCSSESDNERK